MSKTRFKYPPCNTNPKTEKPYLRHRWAVKEEIERVSMAGSFRDFVIQYHVVCERCGFNDPNPPLH